MKVTKEQLKYILGDD